MAGNPGRGRRPEREEGFTLIELLIVVAIIGIISAIAIVNLAEAVDRSRQRQTMATMRGIGTAIESYSADLAIFPTNGQSAAQLAETLSGATFKKVNTTDGWGFDIVYTTDQATYTLESYARDGADGPADIGRSTSEEYDNDILFSDGQFLHSPEGSE